MIAASACAIVSSRGKIDKPDSTIYASLFNACYYWCVLNYRLSGYPLGCIPLNLGPISLGALPPNLLWLLEDQEATPFAAKLEYSSLMIALHDFGFASCSVFWVSRDCSWGYAETEWLHSQCCAYGCECSVYFSPSISFMRLQWPEANGRFLAPMVILAAGTGFLHCFIIVMVL